MFQKHMDGLRTNHQVGVGAQLRNMASRLEAVGPTGSVGGKRPRVPLPATPSPWSP